METSRITFIGVDHGADINAYGVGEQKIALRQLFSDFPREAFGEHWEGVCFFTHMLGALEPLEGYKLEFKTSKIYREQVVCYTSFVTQEFTYAPHAVFQKHFAQMIRNSVPEMIAYTAKKKQPIPPEPFTSEFELRLQKYEQIVFPIDGTLAADALKIAALLDRQFESRGQEPTYSQLWETFTKPKI